MWVPRALAVISCALALLAAQPGVGAVPAQSHRPAVAVADPLTAPALRSEAAPLEAPRRSVRRQPVGLLGSARRLHILATVEILQRLILAELRPGTPERVLAPAMLFEAVPVLLTASPAAPIRPIPPRHLPLPPERLYAIERCLLAPPSA